MALTPTEEALVRQLLDQQAAIISLASNEATITSKLGATKVSLSDLIASSAVGDTDLFLTRQGTTDKSVTGAVLSNSLQKFLQDGTGSVSRTVQDKLKDIVDVRDKGIVANGSTDQTAALLALFANLTTDSFRGFIKIPYNTRFNVKTVYAAVPVGIILEDESSINWGQPPGYKNKFRIMYSGDSEPDDTQQIIASNHHPAITLLNTGSSGSISGQKRFASIIHGVGINADKDPMIGWLHQFGKHPSKDAWMMSYRLQTPYSVAIADPQPWISDAVYSAGAHCISDGGKIYKTSAGGTSGGTAPTGTGASINDGAVTWSYVQAALSIDSSRLQFDEFGNLELFNSMPGGAQKASFAGGGRVHYFEVDGNTQDIVWRDQSRGLDILRKSSAKGTQIGGVHSYPWASVAGNIANPTITSSYCYVENDAATTITNILLPGEQTDGYVLLWFANGNTTLQNGANLTLKGGVNVAPTAGNIIGLVKSSALSGAWVEVSRNF